VLEVLGRKDRQVKINGTRVEPAELESVLRKTAGVADAAVLVRRNGEAALLVAFVASHTHDPREAARREIRRTLPAALNPARLHLIGEIPHLPSGKVDALALERLDDDAQAEPEPSDETTASTAVVSAVENVWRKVLRRRSIAAGCAWDEAGGDSLQLLRCMFELEAELGIDLPLERFAMSMTTAEFAAAITDLRLGRTAAPDRGQPAVIFFPGLTGNTPGFASLSTELEGFHVLTVTYPGWQAMVDLAGTMDHLVEAALGQIVEHFPDGDLRLVGYSLGGAVACEVAARLRQSGRRVAKLVILDTHLRGGSWAAMRLRPDAETARRFWRNLFRSRDEATQLACRMIARLLIRSKRKWLLQVLAKTRLAHLPLRIRFTLHQELTETLQQRWLDRWIRKGPPLERWQLPAVVFRSEDVRRSAVPDLGWAPYFEHTEFVDVTGDHVEMLSRPHRALLAARLATVLNRIIT
jgi:thioesterase domain-containing protein